MDPSKPDAILVPRDAEVNPHTQFAEYERVFGPMLGVDREEGRKLYLRRILQPDAHLLTTDPKATYRFAADHPTHSKQDRYHWVTVDDEKGTQFGWLVEETPAPTLTAPVVPDLLERMRSKGMIPAEPATPPSPTDPATPRSSPRR